MHIAGWKMPWSLTEAALGRHKKPFHRGECADSNMSQCDSFTKLTSLGSVGVGGGCLYCVVQKSEQCFVLFSA